MNIQVLQGSVQLSCVLDMISCEYDKIKQSDCEYYNLRKFLDRRNFCKPFCSVYLSKLTWQSMIRYSVEYTLWISDRFSLVSDYDPRRTIFGMLCFRLFSPVLSEKILPGILWYYIFLQVSKSLSYNGLLKYFIVLSIQ